MEGGSPSESLTPGVAHTPVSSAEVMWEQNNAPPFDLAHLTDSMATVALGSGVDELDPADASESMTAAHRNHEPASHSPTTSASSMTMFGPRQASSSSSGQFSSCSSDLLPRLSTEPSVGSSSTQGTWSTALPTLRHSHAPPPAFPSMPRRFDFGLGDNCGANQGYISNSYAHAFAAPPSLRSFSQSSASYPNPLARLNAEIYSHSPESTFKFTGKSTGVVGYGAELHTLTRSQTVGGAPRSTGAHSAFNYASDFPSLRPQNQPKNQADRSMPASHSRPLSFDQQAAFPTILQQHQQSSQATLVDEPSFNFKPHNAHPDPENIPIDHFKALNPIPPPGYICKLCLVEGHWLKNCQLYFERRPEVLALKALTSLGYTGGRPIIINQSIQRGPTKFSIPPDGYVCRRCNIPGHWIQQCPQPKFSYPSENYTCKICSIKGHWIHQCPQRFTRPAQPELQIQRFLS